MTVYVETAYYINDFCAKHIHRNSFEEMLKEGKILIGKPTVKKGNTLHLDENGHYFIGRYS